MKKTIIKTLSLLTFGLNAFLGQSQNIGINGTGVTADPSALLDVNAVATPSLGILIPRIALQAINLAAPVTAPATSLLVYNTATAGAGTLAVTPGYYYWDATKWQRISNSNDWTTTGNSNTNPSVNYIGTSDAQDLVVKTNNTERMRVTSGGKVGIGTPAPTASLHIVATATNTGFQLQDGTEGFGKFLTSDANGKATWTLPVNVNVISTTFPAAMTVSVGLGNTTTYSGVSMILPQGSWEVEYMNWGVPTFSISNSGSFFYTQLSTSSSSIINPSFYTANVSVLTLPYFNVGAINNTRVITGKWIINIPSGGQSIYIWNGYSSSSSSGNVYYSNNDTGAAGPYSYCYAKRVG